ncbi:MAG: AmmeMemoRadiSam system protein B [Candidatus Aminicenantes bacterium]|nr:AmmeMemoRadiSam system protein B [Candidatus Aminicenantes bacterium]
MIRQPYVAGYFYPSDPERLMSMLKEMIDADAKKNKAKCIISPHAGYVYSGKVAGSVYSSTILPENYVLLGPSHVYMDSRIAIMKQGTWRTPLGDIPVNEELAEMISSADASVSEENEAHAKEHSLEVQLPFLQFFKKELTIVPLCISYYADYGDLEELGKAVAKSIRELHKDTLIIASTDMSHQETQVMAKNKDYKAIHQILNLDPKKLVDTVKKENISMCGFQPTATAIIAAKELGASTAKLIKYQTSGDITGDYDQVVGYAGIRIN